MASSHRIILPKPRAKYQRVTDTEIRVMKNMRQRGFLLREIAAITERDIMTVWSKTAHVTHKNWLKDRYLQRPRAGSMAHLLDAI